MTTKVNNNIYFSSYKSLFIMFLKSGELKFFRIIILLTSVLFITVNFVWPDKGIRKVTIDGDGRGHYLYLPVIFINHTVDFKNAFEKEKKERAGFIGHNFHKINGVYINKFAVGTAVLISPFFLVTQAITILLGKTTDGFSLPFQYAAAIAAWFWLIVGIYFFRKLLKLYNLPEEAILWITIFLITATNLFHYAFLEVTFSHLYSFSIISVFAYKTKYLLKAFSVKKLAFAAFLFGVVVLIRQVNVFVLLVIPFLADDKKQLISLL